MKLVYVFLINFLLNLIIYEVSNLRKLFFLRIEHQGLYDFAGQDSIKKLKYFNLETCVKEEKLK